ncbi:anti-sigma factor [Kitasatospora sp. NPDC085879]|uniref:anti-sigma factor n=1 Tax=Kitasatospora sp. NPDC085879 TaxID=3154769 RepID=UPI003423C0E9
MRWSGRGTSLRRQQSSSRAAANRRCPAAPESDGRAVSGRGRSPIRSDAQADGPAPRPGTAGRGAGLDSGLNDGGEPRAAGLLHTSDGTLLLPAGIDGAHAFALSAEPATGSPQPTTDPVLLLPLV